MPRQFRWKAAEHPSQHSKSPSLPQSLHVSSCWVAKCSLAWLSAHAQVLIIPSVDQCPCQAAQLMCIQSNWHMAIEKSYCYEVKETGLKCPLWESSTTLRST